MSAVGAAQYVAKSIDNIVGLDDDLVWRNSEVYSMLRDIQEELASEVQPAAGITLTPEVAKHRDLLAHDLRVSATVIAELGGFGYEARAVRLRSLADALEVSA